MAGLPTVRSLMDKSFVRLKSKMSIAEAISILLEERITGAVVVDDQDRLIGLLSEKDCLKTLVNSAYDHMPTALVSEYMTKDVFTVHPDMDIFELANCFIQRVNRRFPVVEDGKLVGQVTRFDMLRALQKYWA